MTMQLQTFGPAFGQPDASPFCLKAMCLLHIAGVNWTTVPGSDVRKAPVRKLPVLIDGNTVVYDSDNIRTHLETQYGADFDNGLDAYQRAQSRSIIRMVEEHLYFCMVYDRWIPDGSWVHIKKVFFAELPPVIRSIVPSIARKSVISDLKGQGLGRLSYSEMLARAKLDISAVENLLGHHNFLFGDKPNAADVSCACMLVHIAASPLESSLRECVRENQQLMRYTNRVMEIAMPTSQ